MRLTLAAAVLLALLGGEGISGQVLDDAAVPGGHVRLQVTPVFSSWDSRFGRTAAGETGREALGEDLTTPTAETLFPGAASLRDAIRSLGGLTDYSPVLGETEARVSQDVTRVELGGYIGIFDWLTVGAILPWTRTRSSVDVGFRADTLAGDLGLNPTTTDAPAVSSFLSALSAAETAALASASQTCAVSPGTPECASAQALADRAVAFRGSAETAYAASPFFVVTGSATADALSQATAGLDSDLVAAGLPGIVVPMAFATQRVDEQGLLSLPSSTGSGIAGAPLGSVRGLWGAGDVEVSLTARLLEGAVAGAPGEAPRFTYRLLATLLGRLPTGDVDSVDVFLDVGTGDGQPDYEARLSGAVTIGSRIGLLAGARYGIQRPRTLLRRVAPPELVLAPLSTRQLVEWSPGSYWGVEVAPGVRFSDVLTVSAEYRAFRKYRDEYSLVGSSAGASVDPAVLQEESGVTLHEVGGTLRYDTVARWLGGEAPRPLQFHARLLRAVAGGGGQTPVTTRVEFGVRLFQRLWGTR